MLSYSIPFSDQTGQSSLQKEAISPGRAAAGGAALGGAGNGLLSYLKQKSDIYANKNSQKRFSPYDLARSVVSGAAAGGAIGGGGRLLARHKKGVSQKARDLAGEAKGMKDEVNRAAKEVNRAAKNVGDAAERADQSMKKRFMGFFNKDASTTESTSTSEEYGGSAWCGAPTVGNQVEKQAKYTQPQKNTKPQKEASTRESNTHMSHSKTAAWMGAPTIKTGNPNMVNLDAVEAKQRVGNLYDHIGRAEDAVSETADEAAKGGSGMMTSLKNQGDDALKYLNNMGTKGKAIGGALAGGAALGGGLGMVPQDKEANHQKEAVGLPSKGTVAKGLGALSLGGALGYGGGRAAGYGGAKREAEQNLQENFIPDYQQVTDQDGDEGYQKVWMKRPQSMRGLMRRRAGGQQKSAAVGSALRKAVPSKQTAMRGLGALGLGTAGAGAGFVAGEPHGRQSFSDHLNENYMRGSAQMRTPFGVREVPAVTRRIDDEDQGPDGFQKNEGASPRRQKQASSGLLPVNLSGKTHTIDMKEDVSSSPSGASDEKLAFGLNTIFNFGTTGAGGGPTASAMGPADDGGFGKGSGQSKQPNLPDKSMRTDQSATKGNPKQIDDKIKEMS